MRDFCYTTYYTAWCRGLCLTLGCGQQIKCVDFNQHSYNHYGIVHVTAVLRSPYFDESAGKNGNRSKDQNHHYLFHI